MAYTISHTSNGTTQLPSHASHSLTPYAGAGISPEALRVKQSPSEFANLPPGTHLLPAIGSTPFRHMSPQEVLSNGTVPYYQPTTSNAMTRVQYLERRPGHESKSDTLPLSITFTVHGAPGPYVTSLLAETVPLDGAHDLIFEHWGRSRVDIATDHPEHPGLPIIRINIQVGPEKRAITRQEFTKELAFRLYDSVRNVDHLRLVSINLYGKEWVPILAVDVE
ncbi:hypothetical protein AAF712_012206 [Marasmius tenuissimus]|uniref:Uncharacterized protein n=1 Tax=Marasmius tenuissimus TaxID=585030 RepID=A0ABR2ZH35_9AGAR